MIIKNVFEYLVEHPGSARLAGIILLSLFMAPLIIIWARAGQVRRIRNAYDKLIQEQTTTITGLYREITTVHEELARTRGELAGKIAELKNKDIDIERQVQEIQMLNQKITTLERQERSLIERLKKYEK